jgi:hypothetical protein
MNTPPHIPPSAATAAVSGDPQLVDTQGRSAHRAGRVLGTVTAVLGVLLVGAVVLVVALVWPELIQPGRIAPIAPAASAAPAHPADSAPTGAAPSP